MGITVGGRTTPLLTPQRLLRQKLESYGRRGSPLKRENDLADIRTLCVMLLAAADQKLEITAAHEVASLRAISEANPVYRDHLQPVANCPVVFPNLEIARAWCPRALMCLAASGALRPRPSDPPAPQPSEPLDAPSTLAQHSPLPASSSASGAAAQLVGSPPSRRAGLRSSTPAACAGARRGSQPSQSPAPRVVGHSR